MCEDCRPCICSPFGAILFDLSHIAGGFHKGLELGICDFVDLDLKRFDLQPHAGFFFGIDRRSAFDETAAWNRYELPDLTRL